MRDIDKFLGAKLELRRKNDGAPAGQPMPDADAARIGAEIRDRRKALNLTLQQLSDRCGLSVGHLSEIERGISMPSVVALREIASTLGVTIGWFFHNQDSANKEERDYVVRAGNRRKLGFDSGISDELLSPNLRGELELLLSHFPPGATIGETSYTHRGEEGGLVLEGTIELWIDEKPYVLHEGDSFSFPSSKPHRYRNPGSVEAVVVWAITPPSY